MEEFVVMRRRFNFPAVVAAVLTISAQTSLLRADTISTAIYTLNAPSGLPDPDPSLSAPQVIAEVIPTGGVIVPPASTDNPTGNPLTILPDSHGFDQSQLLVGLKDSGGNPDQQLFGLSFNNGGLQPGGVLHFALSVDGALSTPPALLSQTPGVTITLNSVSPPSTPSDGDPGSSPVLIPEPMSVRTWSILAGLGLVRVRAVRRARLKMA